MTSKLINALSNYFLGTQIDRNYCLEFERIIKREDVLGWGSLEGRYYRLYLEELKSKYSILRRINTEYFDAINTITTGGIVGSALLSPWFILVALVAESERIITLSNWKRKERKLENLIAELSEISKPEEKKSH